MTQSGHHAHNVAAKTWLDNKPHPTLEMTPHIHMHTHAQTVRCLPLAYWLKGGGLADLAPARAPEGTGLQCSVLVIWYGWI